MVLFLFIATPEVSVVGFFSSPQMVVVDVSVEEGEDEGMPLLVCYDSSTRRHSIWSIQQAAREVKSLIHTCTCILYYYTCMYMYMYIYICHEYDIVDFFCDVLCILLSSCNVFFLHILTTIIILNCRRSLLISQLPRGQHLGQTHHKIRSAPLLLAAMETKPHLFH